MFYSLKYLLFSVPLRQDPEFSAQNITKTSSFVFVFYFSCVVYSLFSFVFVFCQSGKIQIFDLASGSLLETTDAHDGALWSMCLSPDQV